MTDLIDVTLIFFSVKMTYKDDYMIHTLFLGSSPSHFEPLEGRGYGLFIFAVDFL